MPTLMRFAPRESCPPLLRGYRLDHAGAQAGIASGAGPPVELPHVLCIWVRDDGLTGIPILTWTCVRVNPIARPRRSTAALPPFRPSISGELDVEAALIAEGLQTRCGWIRSRHRRG